MKWISFFLSAALLAGCGANDGVSLKKDSGSGGQTSVSVSYDGNGHTGGSVPVDGASYKTKASVVVLDNSGSLVKTGSAFTNWNTAADGSGTSYAPQATFSIVANTVLYAQWTVQSYTLMYDGNGNDGGGTVPTDSGSPYLFGTNVSVLPNSGNLAKTGFNFVGWNAAADGSGTSYAPHATFAMPAKNETLYASYDLGHAVFYSANGATSGHAPVDISRYDTGITVTVSGQGNMARTGHTFAGWSIVSDSTHAIDETFKMPANNVTLQALWIPDGFHSVTYNGNGHTGGTIPVDGGSPFAAGALVTVLGNTGTLVRGGDTFLGWNTSANGTGTEYSPSNTFNTSGHVVLYARWTPNYTVTFDANGGTGSMSTKGIAGGTSAKLPANAFVRSGHDFAGWAITNSGPVVYNDKQTFPMGNANTTLYAKWVSAGSLLVNYNFNNRDVQDASGNNKHGTGHNINYVPDGAANYAIQTNGSNSYVALPNNIVKNNPSFTIMMRFKASASQHGSLFGYQNKPVKFAKHKAPFSAAGPDPNAKSSYVIVSIFIKYKTFYKMQDEIEALLRRMHKVAIKKRC